jgi:hypothetical protein
MGSAARTASVKSELKKVRGEGIVMDCFSFLEAEHVLSGFSAG